MERDLDNVKGWSWVFVMDGTVYCEGVELGNEDDAWRGREWHLQ